MLWRKLNLINVKILNLHEKLKYNNRTRNTIVFKEVLYMIINTLRIFQE